mgnify:CR=1 FL=1
MTEASPVFRLNVLFGVVTPPPFTFVCGFTRDGSYIVAGFQRATA